MSEFGVQRKLYKKITADVTQNECVSAMIEYIYCQLPKYYQNLAMPNPEKVAVFLNNHKSAILALPGGILDREEKALLFPPNDEDFDLRSLRVTTLAVLVRYFLPINGGPPDPSNSVWKTRLKLLGDTSSLHYFIRLWRLWNKYLHNEQISQSRDEIIHDFHIIEIGVPVMIPKAASPIMKKIERFRRFINCTENEKNIHVLRSVLRSYDVVANDLRSKESYLDVFLDINHGLERMFIASKSLSEEQEI